MSKKYDLWGYLPQPPGASPIAGPESSYNGAINLTSPRGGGNPPYESQEHHEMGPQISYKQKKTTILHHFFLSLSWYYSFPQIMQSYDPNNPKTHFSKNKKKYPKFFGGVRGAKPLGWKERLLKQVNISFQIMSKPF